METISIWSQILGQNRPQQLKIFLKPKEIITRTTKMGKQNPSFYFEILYKKGKENQVVDSLSRKEEGDVTLCSISIVIPEWISDVQAKYVKNLEIKKIIKEVNNNVASCSKFTWENDILWYKGRIYLPNTSKFKIQILRENHDSPSAGHVGFFKTYYNISTILLLERNEG
jgi:hypothetical protein